MHPTDRPSPCATDRWTAGALDAFVRADADLTALLDLARARLSADPGHDLAHALRVALWTVRLADEAPGGVDRREAVAAALLHDLVDVPKDSPLRSRASELSARQAEAILPGHGFDRAATARVARAIEQHSFSRGEVPTEPLAMALQDADRLEALGAIGVFRTISTGARMGGRYFDPADPFAERRELDDMAFSVDHFFRKLLGLPATMRTGPGRREAERRAAMMVAFLEQLGDELGTPLPAWRIG